MKEVLFPIKHALVFDWVFAEASSLEDITENLREELFYSINARDDILVATSKAKPGVVTFTLMQRGLNSGELILIQTHEGRYSLNELKRNSELFAKKAGIKFSKNERQLYSTY